MESVNYWSLRTPAHIVFMIDQSGYMFGSKAEIASKNVQNAIVDIILHCVNGEVVKRRAYISVFGYGQKYTPVALIRNGWVDEWADDVFAAKQNGEYIIPPTSEWSSPVDKCFSMVYGHINEWIKFQHEEQKDYCFGLGPILVINITDGVVEDKTKTSEIATKIMESQNTWLFNILIPEEVGTDIILPNNKHCLNGIVIDHEIGFYYDISSTLTIHEDDVCRA